MILKKFKEKVGNWTDSDIKTHLGNDNFLKKKMSNYLSWKLNDKFINVNHFFFNSKTNAFFISYEDSIDDNNLQEIIDYNEFIEFINNEELFINSKKYNL